MKSPWLLLLIAVVSISLGITSIRVFGRDVYISDKDNKLDIKELSEKIDEVLKNQQDIIARLKDIRDQQDIIRVRASQR